MSERHALGLPISRAIILPPGVDGEELRPALSAIDRIHGDGHLPELDVKFEPTLVEESKYHWISPGGMPWNIELRSSSRYRLLNLLHEIGHFLDHQAIGIPGLFASPGDDALAEWRICVQKTESVTRLRTILANAKNSRVAEYASYLLLVEELWARCYAQYVAFRSGESGPLRELRERQFGAWASLFPVQWEDGDFFTVEATMEELFRKLGWTS